MEDLQKKNSIKVAFWSIIAIVIGIALSGFIIDALSHNAEASQTANEQKSPSIILSYIDKLSQISKKTRKLASDTSAIIDFGKIIYPPQATYHLKDSDYLPRVGAEAYVVADADTGEVIIEKNIDKVSPIASVTKLMTALVSLEDLPQSGVARVSNRATATLGESGLLSSGEKMKISDLLYPLLLVSSNDASEVLAEYAGRDKFMSLMNTKATEVGMTATNYEDPSGLSGNNRSTARDLLALTHYLFNNHRTVFNITALDKYSLGGRTWVNANRFSRRDDYLGGKTGYTDLAKRTGVAIFSVPFADYGNRDIAVILLKTDDRTKDINNILAYLAENIYLSYDKLGTIKDPEVTLGFVGDIMLDRGVKTSVYKNFGGDFNKIFAEAKFLKDPDIMFANLEGPISDKGHNVGSQYSFRFEPAAASAVKNSGIDIVSFANNHVGDWSDEAFLDTLGRLAEANVLFTGAGETYGEAKKPTVIERSGIRIGYLGFSDVGPSFMTAGETKPGILLASDKNLTTIIKEAKQSVDILVVSVHWGEEYKEHNAHQSTLGKKMIDAGANIVVGHHPHVVQDVEEYNGGLIIYSLGNFVFDQSFSKETMQGLFDKVVVNKSGIKSHEEKTFILNSSYQPALDKSKTKTTLEFSRGICPVGNSEEDKTLFNANSENSVGQYVPEALVDIAGVIPTKDGRDVCLTYETAQNLLGMYKAAHADGVELVVTSGFRSYTDQNYLRQKGGTVDENGNENIAKPGHSEHQLGTTVDFTTSSIGNASGSAKFGTTPEFTWLSKHAFEYGFVMSYPKGASTGYIYEPWHFRYLGIPEAKEAKTKNLTIQEFLEKL